ncbi:MAG: tRNA (adenosine(37)-N6)-threonylcarbamoyltransferase complex dimerization subunit type 1 TsaB [Ruminiclostridium sp.]|nr:tRNA (adenosine(37)-N6)-threonylcarbamoyltransferase complex dimerization subunit type 1 TsaB [Ruminiclostridium sp.]
MIILGIDSSAVSVGAAICETGENERIIASGFINNKITHSQTLMPLIEAILDNSRLTLADIDTFAVSAGPGSFTGLRIGISAVKGMAYALGKPCRAVSVLHAAACVFPLYEGIVCAVMDARCNQVYNALFRSCEGKLTRLCEDRAITISELEEELRSEYTGEHILLCGDGAELCFGRLSGLTGIILAPAHERYQNGIGVCLTAVHYPDITAAALMPGYLRLPQAERERLAKQQRDHIVQTTDAAVESTGA